MVNEFGSDLVSALPTLADGASTVPTIHRRRTGPLTGAATLTVHTGQAHELVQGRPRTATQRGVIGLFGFADRLRELHGTPGVTFTAVLTRIGALTTPAESGVNALIVKLEATKSSAEGFAFELPTSTHPMTFELRFAQPAAFRAARLIARYDRLVRLALGARHVGLLEGARFTQTVALATHLVRRALESAVPVTDTSSDTEGHGLRAPSAEPAPELDVLPAVPGTTEKNPALGSRVPTPDANAH